MRRRVEQSLPARQAGRELKLGPGGLRDIEFAVQLLQLVHGRTDETLRAPATLPALAALAAGGYVGRADAEELAAAYRFLRRTEHLLQLYRLSRTHTLPEDPAVLRRLGRAMRSFDLPNGPWYQPPATGNRSDPAVEFDAHVAPARPAGPAAAREAVLPAAAGRGGPAPVGRGPADPGRGPGPARGARLRRPGRRAAPHRRADHGRLAARGDPAHAAAGPARLVRRRRRARRGPAGLPPGQRGAGGEPVVPAAAAGRDQGGRADGTRAGVQPLRHRPAAACARRGRDVRRRRRARAAQPGRAAHRDDGRGPALRRRRGGGGIGDPFGPPPRAAPDRRRGCARCHPGPRCHGRGADQRHPGYGTGRAGCGHPEGLRRAAAAAADPVRRDRHGPVRRSRVRLRQRRGRAVRARSDAPGSRNGKPRTPLRRWPPSCGGCSPCRCPIRPWSWTPTCGRTAGRARWCARWPRTAPTTAAGPHHGRRRPCCAPSRPAGDEELRHQLHPDDRRVPLPPGRDRAGRRARDPPHQGPGRGRADPARRGPGAARQARPRRAVGRGVDDPAAPAAARARGSRAAHHPDRRGAWRRRCGTACCPPTTRPR